MGAELWCARLERTLTAAEESFLLGLTPPERAEKLSAVERREPLCAYGLLRLALFHRLGWRELPALARTPLGKPYFPACPRVCFSLSHTDGAVLVLLHDEAVGADLERLRPVRPATLRRLGNGAADSKAFLQSWVEREALVKREGGSVLGSVRREPHPTGRVYPVQTFPGYVAAVTALPEQVRLLTLAELLAELQTIYENNEKGAAR